MAGDEGVADMKRWACLIELKPLHVLLSPSDWLMGVLSSVIQVAALSMLDVGRPFSPRKPLAVYAAWPTSAAKIVREAEATLKALSLDALIGDDNAALNHQ